jgi:hypothetical protein
MRGMRAHRRRSAADAFKRSGQCSPAKTVKTIASEGKTRVAPRVDIGVVLEDGRVKVSDANEYRYFAGGEWHTAENRC